MLATQTYNFLFIMKLQLQFYLKHTKIQIQKKSDYTH